MERTTSHPGHHVKALEYIEAHHNGGKMSDTMHENLKDHVAGTTEQMKTLFKSFENEAAINQIMNEFIAHLKDGLRSISPVNAKSLEMGLNQSIQSFMETKSITGHSKEALNKIAQDIQNLIHTIQEQNNKEKGEPKGKVIAMLTGAGHKVTLVASLFVATFVGKLEAKNAPMSMSGEKNIEASVEHDLKIKGVTTSFESEGETTPDSLKIKKIQEINKSIYELKRTSPDQNIINIIHLMSNAGISISEVSFPDQKIEENFKKLYVSEVNRIKAQERSDAAVEARKKERELQSNLDRVSSTYTSLMPVARYKLDSLGKSFHISESPDTLMKKGIEKLNIIDLELIKNNTKIDSLISTTYQKYRQIVAEDLIQKDIFSPTMMNAYEFGIAKIISIGSNGKIQDPERYNSLKLEIIHFSNLFIKNPSINFSKTYTPEIIKQ